MAFSPRQIKYVAGGVLVVVVGIFALSLLWEVLKIAGGLLIGCGLIYLGFRFLLGKGLPKSLDKVVDKALSDKSDKEEST